MNRFKQPWLFVLLIVAGVFYYQNQEDFKKLSFGTSRAHAVQTKTDSVKQNSSLKKQGRKKLNVNLSYPAKKIKKIELSSYQGLNIEFKSAETDQVTLTLSGLGVYYKNAGDDFYDWLLVEQKRDALKIQSYNLNDNSSSGLEKLASLFQSSGQSLKLVIEVPQAHALSLLKFETVSSSIKAAGLVVDQVEVGTVSGSLDFSNSQVTSFNIESVSGSATLSVDKLKKAKFETVSGSVSLATSEKKPEVAFESVSGSLTIQMPAESQVDVNFESMTGSLVNEFGISDQAAGQVQFTSLSGSAEIKKLKR